MWHGSASKYDSNLSRGQKHGSASLVSSHHVSSSYSVRPTWYASNLIQRYKVCEERFFLFFICSHRKEFQLFIGHIMASSKLSLNGVDTSSIDAPHIVTKWLNAFEAALSEKKYEDLGKLFQEDSWWRDTLALSWDLRCPHGLSAIIEYLEQNLSVNGLFNIAASQHGNTGPMFKEQGPMAWVESTFSFETNVGRGRGVLKLTSTGGEDWKAWTISTVLEELKGHEMKIGARAPLSDTYATATEAQTKEEEPTVVVIGAGQFWTASRYVSDVNMSRTIGTQRCCPSSTSGTQGASGG